MTKPILNYILIAALVFSAAFTSCKSKEKCSVKLLESMTDEYGTTMFEYDEENRIAKINLYEDDFLISTQTITYCSDGSVIVESENSVDNEMNSKILYERNGNIITIGNISLFKTLTIVNGVTVNEEGYGVKQEISYSDDEIGTWYDITDYQYLNGNLIKLISVEETGIEGENEFVLRFKYDDKKSPFYYCNTPQWFILHRFEFLLASNNNVIELSSDNISDEVIRIVYKYDNDGFPTSRSTTEKHVFEGIAFETTFTYRCEKRQ